jgi:hypothetical protein
VDAARRPALPDAGTSIFVPADAPRTAEEHKRLLGLDYGDDVNGWEVAFLLMRDFAAKMEKELAALPNAALEQEAERVIRMASTMTTREEHFKTKEAAKALLGEK